MVLIQKPRIENGGGQHSRLICDVLVDDEKRTIWFEVDEEYEPYLCTERCDAYVVALLHWCMVNGHDIVSEVPITDELHYNLTTMLIPILVSHSKQMYATRIDAPLANPIQEGFAVGTGCSCGVDSFYSILRHCGTPNANMNLTHLCVNSVGSFDIKGYREYSSKEEARRSVIARAQEVARELNLKLILVDSNFALVFKQNFEFALTYSVCFPVFAMQKLWRIYYVGSNGYDISSFSVNDAESHSSTYYDLLCLPCFSTSSLQLYADGVEADRLGKMRRILDEPIVQKYLHVCWRMPHNCGQCEKCQRTLLILDVCGKLDSFRGVFDIDYYRAHIEEYYKTLYWNVAKHGGDYYSLAPVYELMIQRKEFADFVRRTERYQRKARVKRIVCHPLRTARKIAKKMAR